MAPSPALAGEGWGEGRGNYDDPHPALRATFSRKSGRRVSPSRLRNGVHVVRRRVVNRLDPVGVDVRRLTPEVGRRTRGIIVREIMQRLRMRGVGGAVAAILDAERIGVIFGMAENVDPLRVELPTLMGGGLDHDVGTRLLGIGDNL